MRKINLTPYPVTLESGDTKPFDMKASCANALFIPDLRLTAAETLDAYALAEKIRTSGDEVLLEEEEYRRLKKAVDTFKGYNQYHVEFIRRVFNAPTVDVKETPEKRKKK